MITNGILLTLVGLETAGLLWDCKTGTTHLRVKAAVRGALAALLLVLLLTGVLEGITRYGGILLLLAVMSAVGWLMRKKKGEQPIGKRAVRIWRTVGCLLLYVTALLPAILFPQFRPLVPTGDQTVETVLYTWTDESRAETYGQSGDKRRLTVRLYYPAEAGQYPLAVYSHGACGTLDANDSTCRELASHGYVVASVAHPYHAMFVEDTEGNVTSVDSEFMQLAMSGPLTHSNAEMLAYYRDWMAIRTADLNFVLDTLLSRAADGEPGGFARIDPSRIGLFGHSMGGATCAAVGRMRDDVDAVVLLEGMMLGELTGADDVGFTYDATPYPLPLLDINSDSVGSHGMDMMFGSREYVNYAVVKNSGATAQEVTFTHAGHMNFCDLAYVSPPLASMMGVGSRDARDCMETVNGVVLAFFDKTLKENTTAENIADRY